MLVSGPGRNAQRGFSLVEVLVALVVCSVGMLGLAKMESIGIESTTVSSLRSLVAIEAAGMAASMHANRAYWASTNATTSVSISGSAPTVTDAGLAAPSEQCFNHPSQPCSALLMAGYDVKKWGQALSPLIQGYTATIACVPTATPVTCTITVNWLESAVAVNTQQTGITAGTFTATQQPTYTLFVQP